MKMHTNDYWFILPVAIKQAYKSVIQKWVCENWQILQGVTENVCHLVVNYRRVENW